MCARGQVYLGGVDGADALSGCAQDITTTCPDAADNDMFDCIEVRSSRVS